MVLFLCETKSQIVNAVALKMSLFANEEADICLVRKIAMPNSYVERIKKTEVFDNVFSVEPGYYPQQDFFSLAKKAVRYATKVKYLSSMLEGKLRDYSQIFVSGLGTDGPAIYYGIKQKNPQIKLNLYEEGTFEYYMFQYTWNTLRKWYSKIFYGSYYIEDAKALYVYEPSMVIDAPNYIDIKTIPRIFKEMDYREKVNFIFGYSDSGVSELKECNCLFIESCYDDKELADAQFKIIEEIYSVYGNKLRVKLHPRSDKTKYDSIGVMHLSTQQSMEMIIMNENINFDKILFVSPLSSAMLNMKMMFGYEPKMILLNNLLKLSTKIGGIQYLAEEFAKRYDRKKMLHPNNFGELKNILRTLKENV